MIQPLSNHQITPRRYTSTDQPAVQSLLAHTPFIHHDRGWQSLETWLAGNDLIACVGQHQTKIAAFLALSLPIEGVSWLRIAALGQGVSRGPTLRRLWHFLRPQFTRHNIKQVNILLTGEQFRPIWQSLDFEPVEAVILLRLEAAQLILPTAPPHQKTIIRPAHSDDLADIVALDHAAFTPSWRLHPQGLQATLQATVKLAFKAEKLAGYIIAHTGSQYGHISRLATHPAQQRSGIGSRLLYEVLSDFVKQGIPTVTVNTQASNTGSQRLYQRFGFKLTGEQWPVYAAMVDKA